jgi:GMP synthase (glutamine-hydrolysing)
MQADNSTPQITVLDAGGQYCHLIARRVRELGVYAEVRPSGTPASELAGRRGIIISGGPSSVYEDGSPTMDPAVFGHGSAVLGICYGLQLMAHLLDGRVQRGQKGEYGHATLQITGSDPLFQGLDSSQQAWMSHRDLVEQPPTGFSITATTSTCPVAAMADPSRRFHGVQFHPEVVHTPRGQDILRNFVFHIAGCAKDWDPRARLEHLEEEIRRTANGRNVFFFVSGGVDSSVAYALCIRALGPDRVRGAYVDTGLMREGETDFVRDVFTAQSGDRFTVVDASADFRDALAGVVDPEVKRRIIGEKFVDVQDAVLQTGHYLDGDWILGQGTIYPDTIESGGTAKADVIKTHHNRVPGIQRLIDAGRIIEPLTWFYKDEVRAVGRELGLPAEMLDRHPFPGPGLAIRLLCSDKEGAPQAKEGGWIVPVLSVGVQGDSRSYRAVLAFDSVSRKTIDDGTETVNRLAEVNRVVGMAAGHAKIPDMRVRPAFITADRLARLRRADAIVRRLCHDRGFESKVWQFPVVMIPFGTEDRHDSIVLRPIDSIDGMTAQAVLMDEKLLAEMSAEILSVPGIAAVLYDLTHKPPATIEWE